MKTILYTAFNEAYAPLAEIAVPRMSDYAKRHGMEFHCFTGPVDDIPDAIYWLKFSAAQRLLREYDRVIWLDVDQLITNTDAKIAIPDEAYGFHVSKDWGHDAMEPHHFSVCGFAAHKDSMPLLDAAWELEPVYRGKPFPEQEPMRQVVNKYMDYSVARLVNVPPTDTKLVAHINIHGRKVFNSVPYAVCPGKVPEPWQPSDFAAHLTMLSIDERVKLAKEILSTLSI